MPETNCRYFNGYKPCLKNPDAGLLGCNSRCPSASLSSHKVLIIHLGALGAVLRSTSLIAPILRKYPNAHITWITQKPADQFFKNLGEIDRVLTTSSEDLLALSCLKFDVVFCIDKSLAAGGILNIVKKSHITNGHKTQIFGFEVDENSGAIVPASKAANELWELGLSNQKKFFENKKPETQLVTEALELDFQRDPYMIKLSQAELDLSTQRRASWAQRQEIVLGINTGCSGVISHKKLTVEAHRELITSFRYFGIKIVLLGGPEDRLRNQQISHGLDVISSPTEMGIRDGLISVQACDLVVTGDSLGMHMALALNKWTVAWFGPTCAHEIDLFGLGVHVITKAPCSPCWKRSCNKNPMCYDLVDLSEIIDGVKKGIQWLMSSSIPRLSVISSLPSRFYDMSKDFGPTIS